MSGSRSVLAMRPPQERTSGGRTPPSLHLIEEKGQEEINQQLGCSQSILDEYNMEIVEHDDNWGVERWNNQKAWLLLLPDQDSELGRFCNQIKEVAQEMSAANASVGFYLIKNPDQIPTEWGSYSLFFWKTTFRNKRTGILHVLYMEKAESRWYYYFLSLNHKLYKRNRALMLA